MPRILFHVFFLTLFSSLLLTSSAVKAAEEKYLYTHRGTTTGNPNASLALYAWVSDQPQRSSLEIVLVHENVIYSLHTFRNIDFIKLRYTEGTLNKGALLHLLKLQISSQEMPSSSLLEAKNMKEVERAVLNEWFFDPERYEWEANGQRINLKTSGAWETIEEALKNPDQVFARKNSPVNVKNLPTLNTTLTLASSNCKDKLNNKK